MTYRDAPPGHRRHPRHQDTRHARHPRPTPAMTTAAWETWGIAARWNPTRHWHAPDEDPDMTHDPLPAENLTRACVICYKTGITRPATAITAPRGLAVCAQH